MNIISLVHWRSFARLNFEGWWDFMKSKTFRIFALIMLMACSQQESVHTIELAINQKTLSITKEQYDQISTYARVLCKMSSYFLAELNTKSKLNNDGKAYEINEMKSSMRFDIDVIDQNFNNLELQKAMKLEGFVEAGITEPARKLSDLLSVFEPAWNSIYLYRSNEAPLDKIEKFDTYFYQIITIEKNVFGCNRKSSELKKTANLNN